jgi:AbiV family abortive infection protein
MGTDVEQVSSEFARYWWKTLMANAVSLIEDASVLATHGSPGRAQALVVLALEELAKARWLYEAAEWEWTAPLGLYGQAPRAAQPVEVPEGLRGTRRPHTEKLQVAEQFASGLGGFWDPARRAEYFDLPDLRAFEATAKRRNLDKQAGFYVDRSADTVTSPLQVPGDGVAEDIRLAAKVIQMHLIEDHTRQQDSPDLALIDSAEDLHWAVMPHSDPDLFTDAAEEHGDGSGASEPPD